MSGTCSSPPLSNFTYTQGSGGGVNFTNTSTNTTSTTAYGWTFGGGAAYSTLINPSVTFTTNGIYTVCLSASNNGTFCTTTSCQTLAITNATYCTLMANYSYANGSNGTVNFISTSTGTNGSAVYNWDFGDGTTAAGLSVSHTYSVNGIYNTILMVSNTNLFSCISSKIQSIVINNSTGGCTANSGFSLAPTFTAQYWTATPTYPWNVTAATWGWGDGSTSNSLYASHQYSSSATYSICLTVTISCGATASTCTNYFIYKSNANNAMININVVAPNSLSTNLSNHQLEVTDFNIYPNPNCGNFEINFKNEINDNVRVSVYSIIGELVYETNTKSSIENINLKNITNGIYFVNIKSSSIDFTKKIIVNK